MTNNSLSFQPSSDPCADYALICRILAHMSERWQSQPDVAQLAHEMDIPAHELNALFRRWAGISPKTFLQALTLNHARALLKKQASILDTTLELGLSSPARLHDLFVTHEALSPGEWKTGAAGLTLTYGFHPTPFGEALLALTPRGLAGVFFVPDNNRASALADMQSRWPAAHFSENSMQTAPYAARIFDLNRWQSEQPLHIILIGSDFEVRVWQALLDVRLGTLKSYSDIASAVNAPKAARAVGAAVGKNPLAFVVPCHRIVGKNATLTGYRWGLPRKQAMLGWEAGITKKQP